MRRLFPFVAALTLLVPVVYADEIYPGYEWHELGDSIYVHSRVDPLAGPVDGSSTVIVNSEDVFVVDTHINPAVARAVIEKIRKITDKPVTHVVNTHWHDDHTNGNHAYRQAFPDVKIVAHRATLASLREEWQPMEEERQANYKAIAGRDLLAAADAVEADDPERAMGIRIYAGYRDALEPELPTMELVYPDLLFDDELVFERGERTIVISWLGRGNTEGDAVVWLPEEKVLITGDVLVAPIPYAFDSPMGDWIGTLGRMAELGAETIVPGHGAVQRDTRYLKQVARLLEATLSAVAEAKAAGVAYADLGEAVDLSELEGLFAGRDPMRGYAWRSYYLAPGLESAWTSLGYPAPEE
jgi:glyoxylase-like metal-dependent hydrolase (beta-lactamase superfamily II)